MVTAVLSKPVRCKRCGRILTDPISIKRGIGPECIERVNLEIDLCDQARAANAPGWRCDLCERPAPVLHKGECPRCYYGVTRLADLDGEPFAEGAG